MESACRMQRRLLLRRAPPPVAPRWRRCHCLFWYQYASRSLLSNALVPQATVSPSFMCRLLRPSSSAPLRAFAAHGAAALRPPSPSSPPQPSPSPSPQPLPVPSASPQTKPPTLAQPLPVELPVPSLSPPPSVVELHGVWFNINTQLVELREVLYTREQVLIRFSSFPKRVLTHC